MTNLIQENRQELIDVVYECLTFHINLQLQDLQDLKSVTSKENLEKLRYVEDMVKDLSKIFRLLVSDRLVFTTDLLETLKFSIDWKVEVLDNEYEESENLEVCARANRLSGLLKSL